MRSRLLLATAVILAVVSCGGETATTTDAAAQGTEAPVETAAPVETTAAEAMATTTTVADTAADTGASTGMECALVPAGTVAAVFGGASASGEPGIARNCTFTIEGGLVPTVEVFHFGSSADWEGVKAGYEENRGGVTAVDGVGEEAYQPNDVGPYEIVVKSGDIIFAVAVQTGGGGPEVEAAILELAGEIAGG
jgi:hypothetical protein